jgi:hypothetical protein
MTAPFRLPLFTLLPSGVPERIVPLPSEPPPPTADELYIKTSIIKYPPQIVVRNRQGMVILRVCAPSVGEAFRQTKAFLSHREADPGPDPAPSPL